MSINDPHVSNDSSHLDLQFMDLINYFEKDMEIKS